MFLSLSKCIFLEFHCEIDVCHLLFLLACFLLYVLVILMINIENITRLGFVAGPRCQIIFGYMNYTT